MRFSLAASLAVAALGLASHASGFQSRVSTSNTAAGRSWTALAATTPTDLEQSTSSPCAIPDGVIPESVTAQGLRSAILTNANGELVSLGEQMGKGTSVVVFLRHLG